MNRAMDDLDIKTAKNSQAKPQSLVGRLVRAALLWAIPLMALAAFALTWLYRSSTYQIFEGPLSETVTSLINSSEMINPETGPTIIAINQEPVDPRYQRALSGSYWQVYSGTSDQDLKSEISSRSLYGSTLDIDPKYIQELIDKPGLDLRANAMGPDGERLRVVARSVILPQMQRPLIMMAAIDQGPAMRSVQRFAVLSVLFLTTLAIGLIGAVLLQVRTGLRPLFDLRDRVADVREGRAVEVTGDYPKEIDPLAGELNSLIAHNKDIVDRARTHVSNLAHALKTPLAVLKNEANTSSGALADLTTRQTDIMTRQVNHHLSRARAAARAKATTARTDASTALKDLSRTLTKIYQGKGVAIVEDIPSGLSFRGEKHDFDEMAGNLLDNACKWSASLISLKTRDLGDGQLEIIVADDGPGLEPKDYAAALQRGMRLDETTPGTGFGLSIVDDLARAYKGHLELSRAELGGLSVRLVLPAAAPLRAKA